MERGDGGQDAGGRAEGPEARHLLPQPAGPEESRRGTWGGGRGKLQGGHPHTGVDQVHVGRPRGSRHFHGAAWPSCQQLERPHSLRQGHHLGGGHHLGQVQQWGSGAQACWVPRRGGEWYDLRSSHRGWNGSWGQREGGGRWGAGDYLGQGPWDFLSSCPRNSPLDPFGLRSLRRSLLQPNLSSLRVQDQGSLGLTGSLGAGLWRRGTPSSCEQQGPQAGGLS